MENDLFNITIKFAEDSFKASIKRSDEQLYRSAANYVDNKFQEYRKRYPKQHIEKHLSLVSLEIALELLKEKEENDSVYNRIEILEKELKENLKK